MGGPEPVNPMRVLVTGGAGFVMSNVVRTLLEGDDDARAVVLDLGPSDAVATEFFAPFEHRLDWVTGDIRDAAALDRAFSFGAITHIVHGATLTHYPALGAREPRPVSRRERDGYRRVAGSGAPLRRSAAIHLCEQRCGVRRARSDQSGRASARDRPLRPPRVSTRYRMFAAEQVSHRYRELFGIDLVRVRFSGVFGPMERPTGGRVLMSAAYWMMRAHLERRPLGVTRRTLAAGGDFLSAEDVAGGVAALLNAPRCAHEVYNIALGSFVSMPEVFEAFASIAPGFEHAVVDEAEADVIMEPENRLARWNAYAIDRICNDSKLAPPASCRAARWLLVLGRGRSRVALPAPRPGLSGFRPCVSMPGQGGKPARFAFVIQSPIGLAMRRDGEQAPPAAPGFDVGASAPSQISRAARAPSAMAMSTALGDTLSPTMITRRPSLRSVSASASHASAAFEITARSIPETVDSRPV